MTGKCNIQGCNNPASWRLRVLLPKSDGSDLAVETGRFVCDDHKQRKIEEVISADGWRTFIEFVDNQTKDVFDRSMENARVEAKELLPVPVPPAVAGKLLEMGRAVEMFARMDKAATKAQAARKLAETAQRVRKVIADADSADEPRQAALHAIDLVSDRAVAAAVALDAMDGKPENEAAAAAAVRVVFVTLDESSAAIRKALQAAQPN